jgi:hypothetical protein
VNNKVSNLTQPIWWRSHWDSKARLNISVLISSLGDKLLIYILHAVEAFINLRSSQICVTALSLALLYRRSTQKLPRRSSEAPTVNIHWVEFYINRANEPETN